jgi:hypothetical protein
MYEDQPGQYPALTPQQKQQMQQESDLDRMSYLPFEQHRGGFTIEMMENALMTGLQDVELDQFMPMFVAFITRALRIPNLSKEDYGEKIRDLYDLVDRSRSQGRRRVVASKMLELYASTVLLASRGDAPLPGLTGMSLMISNRGSQETTLKTPPPPQQPGMLSQLIPWGKK